MSTSDPSVPSELSDIRKELATFRQRHDKNERRFRRICILAGIGTLLIIGTAWNREAVAQGYGMTLEQAAARIAALETRTTGLETKTASMSATTDANGYPTVRFTGVNVQVVDGSDITGPANGLGNLIVGYNETNNISQQHTGRMSVIVGFNHTYTANACLVAGVYSTVSADNASVSGGYGNIANGPLASISGGYNNRATGSNSVSGGMNNTASSGGTSVSGGYGNTASGAWASVSGGYNNTASEFTCSVSGGNTNQADAMFCSVSGGLSRSAREMYNWRAGNLFQEK